MATSLAIGVTIVGVAAIIALLGILARQFGLFTIILNWIKATKEERTKLFRDQGDSPSRYYIDQTNGYETHANRGNKFFYKFDNDLDWVNLWPRPGSYKRFSNYDAGTKDDVRMRLDSNMGFVDPSIPPQPLRPAPEPPQGIMSDQERMSSQFSFSAAGEMMKKMMRDRIMMPYGEEIRRVIPMLHRADSNSSMKQRMRMDLAAGNGSPERFAVPTNPFASTMDYDKYEYGYTNPFTTKAYYNQPSYSPQMMSEDERLRYSMFSQDIDRSYSPSYPRTGASYLSLKSYDDYDKTSILIPDDMEYGRTMDHNFEVGRSSPIDYMPNLTQSSSQIAYNHSLNQARLQKRQMQEQYLARYDKILKDEERIRKEEQILHKLRFENDLMRIERYDRSLQSSPQLNYGMRNTPILGQFDDRIDIDRESMADNLAYDYQRGASDVREELQKRKLYDIRSYTSQEFLVSPPPPAPDVSLLQNPKLESSKPNPLNWQNNILNENMDSKVPSPPPNTASLSPPNQVLAFSLQHHRPSLDDPTASNLLQEKLGLIQEQRYRDPDTFGDDARKLSTTNTNPFVTDDPNMMAGAPVDALYCDIFTHTIDEDDPTNEINPKFHDPHKEKGPDIYPKALKERVQRRREGSKRKRKRASERRRSRERSIERKSAERSPSEPISTSPDEETPNDGNQRKLTDVIAKNDLNEATSNSLQMDSALVNLPVNIDIEEHAESNSNIELKENCQANIEPQNLFVSNLNSRNLGDSPVVPRKSFLAYKDSWNIATNNNELELTSSKDDSSTERVREYIASLNAKIQELPDDNKVEKMETCDSQCVSSPAANGQSFPTAISYPITPPSSDARTNSMSSNETPSSTMVNWGSTHAWKWSTETPPSSVGITDDSPRPSYSETPPSSAGFCGPTSQNSASSCFPETVVSGGSYTTPPNSGGLNGAFDLNLCTNQNTTLLKRAMSCDSEGSDSSITLKNLEDDKGHITGYLTVQIIYDGETQDLEVVVIEGRELIGTSFESNVPFDSYIRVFLLPDKSTNMQTRVAKQTVNPSFKERFLFALDEDEALDRSLAFYLYCVDKYNHTMIGEAQIRLGDINFDSHSPIELTLTDSGQRGLGYGEILFSLSYLPTAERLTVVIVKARHLKFGTEKESPGDPMVKVFILQNGKKIMKKKTTVKRSTDCPLFNEAMIFNVPSSSLHNIQLRLSVVEYVGEHSSPNAIGHVIVGTQATSKALSHWNQMISSLRKPVGMWHTLRR